MAVQDKNVVAWAALAVSVLAALVPAGYFVGGVDGRLKGLEEKVAELTKVINDIAPRKVKAEPAAAPMSLPPAAAIAGLSSTEQLFSPIAVASASPAGPLPDPNDDTATWPARYLADHCRRCPSCCITLSTAALP